jgi:hypothetical protein
MLHQQNKQTFRSINEHKYNLPRSAKNMGEKNPNMQLRRPRICFAKEEKVFKIELNNTYRKCKVLVTPG